MPRLLIVHHSPTRSMAALTEQVVSGAHDDALEGVEVVVTEALATTPEDLLAADGYVLGTPANFGYMSGALKHVFDTSFLRIGGALEENGAAGEGSAATAHRPFGLYVHGRYDVTGAVRSVLAITGALGWKQGFEVVEVIGDPATEHRERAYDLGGTIAALLAG